MIQKLSHYPAPRIAFLGAMAAGLTTHLFGIVNVLHNQDDIAQQATGYGTGVTSGRWFLTLLGDFCNILEGNHNLPFLNGILFLVLIAVSAGLVVSVFRIRNQTIAALTGALFAVFPTVFSTLTFRYSSVYYGIGIVLSVLAVWVLQRQFRLRTIFSALCIACSMGIYQAYVPITISIFVLLLLLQSLDANADLKKLICQGFYSCFVLLLGLLFYFGLMHLTLNLYNAQLSDYQGVSNMGKLSLETLPGLLKEAIYSVVMLPFQDYCGVAAMSILRLAYLLVAGVSGLLLVWLWWKQVKKPLLILFGALMCCLLPIAFNFIVFICPDGWIYTLMVYSWVLLPCVPLLLLEKLLAVSGEVPFSSIARKCVTGLLAVILCCYCYQTNVNYTALYYSNRQMENYLNSLIVQIRMTDGFTPDMPWAFLGEVQDPLLHSNWDYEMTYGGIEPAKWMMQRYSWHEWIRHYYGYAIPMADADTTTALAATEAVKNMPCWPSNGSIIIIDDTVVIKFQELS